MKQKIFYVLVFLFAVGAQMEIDAQNHKGAKAKEGRLTPEQRIERQTAHLATSLMLDDATTVKFSEIYKSYLKEMQECQRSGRMAFGGKGKIELTDDQIEAQIEARFVQSRKILDIREKYYKQFKKVLKPRQIMKIYAEEKANGAKVKKELERRNNKKKTKK